MKTMTPKQKAAQIYDEYWSAVSRGPVCKTDELPDMRPLLEQAIIEAVEEERDGLNPDYEFTFTPREQLIIRLFLMGQEIEDVSARIGSPIERVQKIKSMIIRKLEHSENLRAKRNLTSGKEGRF